MKSEVHLLMYLGSMGLEYLKSSKISIFLGIFFEKNLLPPITKDWADHTSEEGGRNDDFLS